jgi:hypothetical protein
MTDELREKIFGEVDLAMSQALDCEGLGDDYGKAMNAAADAIMELIGGVEDELLERLAGEAGEMRVLRVDQYLTLIRYETPHVGNLGDSLADWLRKRKGGA